WLGKDRSLVALDSSYTAPWVQREQAPSPQKKLIERKFFQRLRHLPSLDRAKLGFLVLSSSIARQPPAAISTPTLRSTVTKPV
ncbi:hypothetical protein, partial [Pseudomonas sp. Q11]|uniref:hypothetical protein n=1 Tax=Pseudomonas sp. Q11 TaxID=2968470 RepID=UPI00210BE7B3